MCGATSYFCYKECKVATFLGIFDETLYGFINIPLACSVCWYGVGLSLWSLSLTVNGTEIVKGESGCAAIVFALNITSKDENLIRLQMSYVFRRYP